ncbi:MAG: hypothetical protein QOC62_1986, partial [Mycobacterium sp.]|nr:hypothetical protein [Mycobacterium sp.]
TREGVGLSQNGFRTPDGDPSLQ